VGNPTRVVVIDPGHGGRDPGAVGPSGIAEKEVTLDIALKVEQYLSRAGFDVTLTRRGDNSVSAGSDDLTMRAAIANNLDAIAFVSVHCNSMDNPDIAGMEVFYKYNHPRSAALAVCVHGELLIATNRTDRGIKTQVLKGSTIDKPVDYYAVLRSSRVPSIIVETAFISNRAEEKLLSESWFREKVAMGISNGVRKYAGILV